MYEVLWLYFSSYGWVLLLAGVIFALTLVGDARYERLRLEQKRDETQASWAYAGSAADRAVPGVKVGTGGVWDHYELRQAFLAGVEWQKENGS